MMTIDEFRTLVHACIIVLSASMAAVENARLLKKSPLLFSWNVATGGMFYMLIAVLIAGILPPILSPIVPLALGSWCISNFPRKLQQH